MVKNLQPRREINVNYRKRSAGFQGNSALRKACWTAPAEITWASQRKCSWWQWLLQGFKLLVTEASSTAISDSPRSQNLRLHEVPMPSVWQQRKATQQRQQRAGPMCEGTGLPESILPEERARITTTNLSYYSASDEGGGRAGAGNSSMDRLHSQRAHAHSTGIINSVPGSCISPALTSLCLEMVF